MQRKRQNKDGTYWFRCESQWKYAKEACVVVSAKEKDILEQILLAVKKYSDILCRQAVVFWQNRDTNNEKHAAAQEEIITIRQELSKTKHYLRGLYESLVSGIISQEEYRQMKSDYEGKIADLQDRGLKLECDKQDFERNNDARFDLFECLRNTTLRPDLTAELIDELVDKILVYPDKSVEVIFKFQDELEVECVG